MGNHALWKACELLGIASNGVNHIEHPAATEGPHIFATRDPAAIEGPHLFIKRDPRNALVSWVRFEGLPVTQGTLITAMASYLPQLPLYEGWLTDPDTLVVTFERLVADDQQMREIAAFAGVPYLDDAWPNLPNHTKTWTGRLSDYREHWTPAVDAAWVAAGGPALLERWGY
jgi:hypothetical protein